MTEGLSVSVTTDWVGLFSTGPGTVTVMTEGMDVSVTTGGVGLFSTGPDTVMVTKEGVEVSVTAGAVEVLATGPGPVMVVTKGVEASVATGGVELLAAGPEPVMVMTESEEPGPPGTVTVNTGAASDSADEAGAAGPVPTVDSKVKVKLAVLIGWEEGSFVGGVTAGDTEVVSTPLGPSITV